MTTTSMTQVLSLIVFIILVALIIYDGFKFLVTRNRLHRDFLKLDLIVVAIFVASHIILELIF